MDKIIFYWLKIGLMEELGCSPYSLGSKKTRQYCYKSKEILNKIKFGVRVNPKRYLTVNIPNYKLLPY